MKVSIKWSKNSIITFLFFIVFLLPSFQFARLINIPIQNQLLFLPLVISLTSIKSFRIKRDFFYVFSYLLILFFTVFFFTSRFSSVQLFIYALNVLFPIFILRNLSVELI